MARPCAMGRLFHFSSEDHHFATDYEKQYFHDRQTETLENIIGIQEREQLRSRGLSVSLMSSHPNVFTRDISVYHLFTSKCPVAPTWKDKSHGDEVAVSFIGI